MDLKKRNMGSWIANKSRMNLSNIPLFFRHVGLMRFVMRALCLAYLSVSLWLPTQLTSGARSRRTPRGADSPPHQGCRIPGKFASIAYYTYYIILCIIL